MSEVGPSPLSVMRRNGVRIVGAIAVTIGATGATAAVAEVVKPVVYQIIPKTAPTAVGINMECSPGTTPATPSGNPYDIQVSLACIDTDNFEKSTVPPTRVSAENVTPQDDTSEFTFVARCLYSDKKGETILSIPAKATDNLIPGDPKRYSVACFNPDNSYDVPSLDVVKNS
ncbi:hypothetical protein KBC85_01900 [Candidatus Saccharibacteria bacterium]|nr:hypothetical protein [Candidatus Saccharibacteria bacterium]MDQ5885593.1 hypothetical protein [Patescibacteria group bacterium]MDQ5953660.1 hypothetical protein [Patescibacteria group bacterium]MDQ5958713.1 hypothetical protein [Patescibacteria group bacterium]